jgi:hypothetical protein
MADVDDAIVKRCMEPKGQGQPYGSRSTMGPTAPILLRLVSDLSL